MSIPLEQIVGMPAFCSYYPLPPARYRNVRFQYVSFGADPAVVDDLLPACFTPSADGACLAFGLSVAWSANYGAFEEAGIVLKCQWRDRAGWFCPVVFLNSRGSIPAGREIYGTPKVAADISVSMEERVMATVVRLAGAAVFSIRSTMHRPATAADLPALAPAWRLKAIPRADGRGAEVLQLVDASPAMSDVTVHVACTGDGVVEFAPSPIYDLSRLVPREYHGAHYAEMDYTEGYAEIVHDFLPPRTTVKGVTFK
jgi:acetoacetate decarboxylase